MQARYYDPVIGRFLGEDPVTFLDTDDPRYFNRYAYAGNNPINNIDSTGQWIEDVFIGIPSAGLGIYSAYGNFKSGNIGAGLLDTAGVIVDGVAIAVPGVPGGAGFAINGVEAGVKHGDEVVDAGNRVYRSASGTPTSMTPCPKDVDGLSANISPDNLGSGKVQVIDTSKLDKLCAVCDNPATGHVSIRPKNMDDMPGWIASRGSDTPHELTDELMGAVVDEIRN